MVGDARWWPSTCGQVAVGDSMFDDKGWVLMALHDAILCLCCGATPWITRGGMRIDFGRQQQMFDFIALVVIAMFISSVIVIGWSWGNALLL